MSIAEFIEGPLLEASLIFFAAAFVVRGVIFGLRLLAVVKTGQGVANGTLFGEAPFPLHAAIIKRPLYTLIRVVFHLGLIVLPVFLSAHVMLWESSDLGWSWAALPDDWAEGLIWLLLALCAYFILRRIFSPALRGSSRPGEWLVAWLAGLPILSGYLLSRGIALPAFLEEHIYTIHIFLGELMLIGAGFLFTGLKVSADRCVGCSACQINCPTEALKTLELADERRFSHTSRICLVCGRCHSLCPEGAVSFYHGFSPRALIGGYARRLVSRVKLVRCSGCGVICGPEVQWSKVFGLLGKPASQLCPDCQGKEQLAKIFHTAPRLPLEEKEEAYERAC